MRAKTHIQQIFYDDLTRSQLDPALIPLDNCVNARPDWYEFWIIKNYLERNALEPDTWYGFLSPKFQTKTGMDARVLHAFLDACETSGHEVFMVPAYWQYIAMYQNPYIQGEFGGHTGILYATQRFLDRIGLNFDLQTSVAHSENFTFCNYVIAKPTYWQAWLKLAQTFFDIVENDQGQLGQQLRSDTSYLGGRPAPIKTFIQERFPYLIVQNAKLKSRSPGHDLTISMIAKQGDIDINTLSLIDSCNLMKIFFSQTGQPEYLQAFHTLSREAAARWHLQLQKNRDTHPAP